MKDMEVEVFECPEELLIEKKGRVYRNIVHAGYHSEITGTERFLNIVLPDNYSEDKKYPILYVLHGFFGNEGTMLVEENSFIPEILGNMYDAGLAKEVIAVYPNIYVNADANLAPGFTLESLVPYDRIIAEIIQSIEPFMKANYSVLDGRENRAILGFSFGAREALNIGIMRSDLFANICAVSPAPGLIPGKDWAMEHPGMFAANDLKYRCPDFPLDLLIVCRGSKDSVVGRFPVEYHEAMQSCGLEHIWYETEGLEHDEKIVQSATYNLMIRWK